MWARCARGTPLVEAIVAADRPGLTELQVGRDQEQDV
jgi:hypothetical protein